MLPFEINSFGTNVIRETRGIKISINMTKFFQLILFRPFDKNSLEFKKIIKGFMAVKFIKVSSPISISEANPK